MAEPIGGAVYVLEIDNSRFVAGGRQSEQTLRNLRREGQGLDVDFKGVARTGAAVALGMGGLSLAITGTRTAIQGTVKAASDLNESMSKNRQVFRDSAAEVERWSRSSARDFGLSQQAALEAAGTYGNLFTAMRIGRPEAARLSMDLTELAADLASFNNLRINDVLIALRAGLVGEIEPLRRFGIAINDNVVKQKAMDLGLADNVDSLTEAAKVQARYALILEQSTNAQGDFARTAGEQANAQRILAAEAQNAGAKLGQQLLPAINLGTKGLTELLGVGNELADDVLPSLTQAAVLFAAALAAAKLSQFAVGLGAIAAQRIAVQRALGGMQGLQVGAIGGATAATRAAGVGLLAGVNPVVAGVVALTAAFIGLDIAARRFTGSGIIDHLTGQAAGHRRAAAAAKHHQEVTDALNRAQREGISSDTARTIQVLQAEKLIIDAQRERARVLSEIESKFPGGLPTGVGSGRKEAFEAIFASEDAARKATDEAADKIIALGLGYKDLASIVQRFPELGPRLAEELELQRRAAGAAAVAMADYEIAITAAKAAQDLFANALGDLQGLAEEADLALNEQIESLRLEQLELEQMKSTMGSAFGPSSQARLDEVTRKLDVLTGQQDIVNQRIALFGARVRREYGDLAPAMIQNVTDLLTRLPDEEQIKLLIVLPDLVKIEAIFTRFIAALRAGARVDIALRLAATGAFPGRVIPQDTRLLPGETPQERNQRIRQGAGDRSVSDDAQRFIDDLQDQLEDFNRNAVEPLGPIADKSAAGLSRLEQVMQAVADGTIDLSEAIALGLSDQQVVTLELAAAENELANQRFRQRIELLALARAYPGLTAAQVQHRIGLGLIMAHLERTGQTIEQFLRDVNAGILSTAQNAINQLLGGPTRESLELDLRMAHLRRRRSLLLSGGAAEDDKRIEAIDREIDALQDVIDLRRSEIDIMRISAQLADQTLRTDRELVNAFTWLIGVVGNFSEAIRNATTFLADFAGLGTDSGTSVQSFMHGTPYVPRTGLARLHEGERVITAAENRQLTAGTPAPLFEGHWTISVSDERAIRQQVMRQLDEGLARARRKGSMGSTGTFRD